MPDLPTFSWDDLRFFLLAAQAGTLAGAARAAGVQHTTIGRRLSALERSLGVALFVRGPEGLTLTPMGVLLLPLAQKAANDMQAVREFVATRRNRVRLALPSGFVALFAEDLARLARERPDITLETVSGGQLADLQRGDADLALRIGPIRDPDLVARSLGEVGSSLYASPRYLQEHPAPPNPFNPPDLRGHRIVAFGAELSAMPAARWLEANTGGATVVLRTNEMTTMLEAAASGAGLALLPCMLADPDPRLVRLTPEVLARRGLSLVYRREQRGNRPVRTVAVFLIEALRLRADRISGVLPGTAVGQ
jgi:DNA-binding transcriptional LysR family regulator